jgi:hypothetical protein
MKNLEDATISFCDNGFMLSFSYIDARGEYKSVRRVFTTTMELYTYLDLIVAAKNSNDNTSI